jgi:hypothetical protein
MLRLGRHEREHEIFRLRAFQPTSLQMKLQHLVGVGWCGDPRITTETYGHLQPDYLRSEIDRLRFDTAPANDLTDLPNASNRSQPSAANSRKLLTTFLQGPRSAGSTPSEGVDFRQELPTLTSAGWTGLEGAASGVTGRLGCYLT